MESIVCASCGSTDFLESDTFLVCVFCRSKYAKPQREVRAESTIAVGSDITDLLEKCKTDPHNAARYANLILDLDPNNAQAHAILNPPKKKKKLFGR